MIKVTWEELTKLEPKLIPLYEEIKSIVDDKQKKSFCANTVWRGHIEGTPNYRELLSKLVGWEAKNEHPIMKTSEAYDVAYETLYDLLPPCRNCFCL